MRLRDVMKDNAENWYSFLLRKQGRDIKREEMLLVTGCDLTSRWTSIIHSERDQRNFLFRLPEVAPINVGLGAQGMWSSNSLVPPRSGPTENQRMAREETADVKVFNQCVFLRAWRHRKPKRVPVDSRAAAEPEDLEMGRNNEGNTPVTAPVSYCSDGDEGMLEFID